MDAPIEAVPAANDNDEAPRKSLLLPNEFEIEIPAGIREPWNAANGRVGVTVYPDGGKTSKDLDGRPAHLFKNNRIRKACTPNAFKEQWLIAELGGVFVHIHDDPETGKVHIVVANERLS